jgi:uncharacterized protein (DUF58 family)
LADETRTTSIPGAQYTALLTNEQLARVEKLRINTNRRLTNRARGEHVRGKGGASTDFADYRNYVSGDDLRFVDWNIFSRLHKPYLKVFHQEEELHVVVLLDASSSMDFDGKFDLAKKLAATFCIAGLFATERVSVYSFNDSVGGAAFTGPVRGRASMAKLLRFIEERKPGGDAPVDIGVDKMFSRHRGRGVAIVLSDFLTMGDLRRTFNTISGHGLEPFATQILSPVEIDPDLTNDLRLVDCETNQTLDITAAGELVNLYHEYLQRYEHHLAALARQRNGRYLRVNSADRFDTIVFDTMRRKGWLL